MYLINKIINITFKKYMIKLAIQIQNSMDLETYASIIFRAYHGMLIFVPRFRNKAHSST